MDKIVFKKGSEWRKWDLHFHTPSSYDYKNRSVSDDELVETMSKNDISVIAVTDHHFIDIDRITNIKRIANSKNITILPGIEFCADMRGSEPIHFIGIFSEDSNINHIWGELNSKANIASQKEQGKNNHEIYCDLIDTCKLIKALGGIISIHSGSKQNSIESITNSLPVKMAHKKDILQYVDIFELGKYDDQSDYTNIVFPQIGIHPMVICSDNHNITDYRLKSNCWIKADPTFDGLKQIIYEPTERVFIGDFPSIFERVKNNKTKYLHSLKLNNVTGYSGYNGIWFKDIDIEFNKELIAIIGNKGSGKSAISDIIGLLGDTHNGGLDNSNFSFLTKNKFLKKGYCDYFEGTLKWEDGSVVPRYLSHVIDTTQKEKVKYLPQNYFENLTNEIDSAGFINSLKSVIFYHIPMELRYGKNYFDELLVYKSASIKKDITLLSAKCDSLSNVIVNLGKKKHPYYLKEISNQLADKEKEMRAHNKNKPKVILAPSLQKEMTDKLKKKLEDIDKFTQQLEEIDTKIDVFQSDKLRLTKEKEDLLQIIDDLERFETEINEYKDDKKEILDSYGLDMALGNS